MDLAAVAAFTAAGLSLVNVVVTAWLARRLHFEQWRRDRIIPAVERILALAREAEMAWSQAAVYRELQRVAPDQAANYQEEAQEHWDRGKAAWDDLSSRVAQLDLIAAEPVRKAAEALRLRLESMGLRIRRGSPNPLRALEIDVYPLMAELTAEARTEIGADRGVTGRRLRSLTRWPWRSPADVGNPR